MPKWLRRNREEEEDSYFFGGKWKTLKGVDSCGDHESGMRRAVAIAVMIDSDRWHDNSTKKLQITDRISFSIILLLEKNISTYSFTVRDTIVQKLFNKFDK